MKRFVKKLIVFCLCLCLLGTSVVVTAAEDQATTGAEESGTKDPETTTPDGSDTPTEPTEPVEPVKPVAPTLSGTLSASKTVTLSWTSTDASASYTVFRATSKTGTYQKVSSVKNVSGKRTYKDSGLTLGKTYYYKLAMTTANSVSCESEIISVKVRLLAPTNLKTTRDSSNDLTISWGKVTDATGYSVYRSTSKNGTYKKVKATTKTSYKDTTPLSAKAYYYKVYAYRKNNSNATSVASTVVAGYTKPLKTTIATAKYTSGKVKLTWKKVTRATKYYIYRMKSDGTYTQIGTSTSCSYTDQTAKKNVRYKYKVKAAYTANGKTIKGSYSALKSIYTAQINAKKKMIALTFDDGPGPYTQAIVNCLKKYNARATFFVVGNRVNSYKAPLKSAYQNGNQIANHTYTHATLTTLGTSKVKSQISKTDAAVKKVTGEATSVVRAPGGSTNSSVRSAIDKPFIYWSIDTLDWKHRNKQTTINTVMKNVKDGDIILMHDIHKPSKEAALELIPKLVKAGYQLVTVEELAQYQGYHMKNHTTYYSFR